LLSLTESRLRRKQALDWLAEIEARPGPAASVYIPPGTLLPEIETTMSGLPIAGGLPAGLAEIIAASPTGGAVFRSEHTGDLLVPPFPVANKHTFLNLYTEPLREVLSRDLTVAVILLRLGMYAIGLFRGEKLVASRVGTGNIQFASPGTAREALPHTASSATATSKLRSSSAASAFRSATGSTSISTKSTG